MSHRGTVAAKPIVFVVSLFSRLLALWIIALISAFAPIRFVSVMMGRGSKATMSHPTFTLVIRRGLRLVMTLHATLRASSVVISIIVAFVDTTSLTATVLVL